MQPNDSSSQESSNQPESTQSRFNQTRSTERDALTPVEALQKRYADQLSQDIEQLEAQKSKLREDIQTLTRAYTRLQASVDSLRRTEQSAIRSAEAANKRAEEQNKSTPVQTASALGSQTIDHRASDSVSDRESKEGFFRPTPIQSPRLPGESAETVRSTNTSSTHRAIELPIPATSERKQRRRLSVRSRRVVSVDNSANERRATVLRSVSALLIAWNFCVIAALGQGGRWLGISIGSLGIGLMPAVALLWLRMLVVVPALVFLAPQLHKSIWNDLRDWIDKRDGLLMLLIGSGVALFISQILLYQCLGVVGAAIGVALLFLYPMLSVPLGIALRYQRLSALNGLALVAIAMGSVLTLKPLYGNFSLGFGLSIGFAFGLFVSLSHLAYRQPNCHPISASFVQFGVVAALSSVVLLLQPLEPESISWLSFAVWGLILGFSSLLAYLIDYGSRRLDGAHSLAPAATLPLITLLIAYSFSSPPSLAITQWTGIALISAGGFALFKETLIKEITEQETLRTEEMSD